MTRFRLTVEFDGRPFMGWQRQAHGPTVQQAIEEAITAVTGEKVAVHAAGRTDAGVHARAMVAHVDIERPIAPFRLMGAISAMVRPAPVSILDCRIVPDDWHARYSCVRRRYIYRIINRRPPLTLENGLAWRLPEHLDTDAMQQAAQILVGPHDFTTFRSVHCQSASPVKRLGSLDVRRTGEIIEIEAIARSFLHHQVRSMVGCLALVGRGRWSAGDMRDALEAKDRKRLGYNAPPDGLYFMDALYPE
jgi:tRNA pseudouridine38-40 synthase